MPAAADTHNNVVASPSWESPTAASGRQVWTGYVDVAHPHVQFRFVASNFIVPAVTCTHPESKASFWVGLDGYGNGTVEQVGLSTNCIPVNGVAVPVYQVWWEMFPDGVHYVRNAIPGDHLALSVFYNSSTDMYRLSITDKNFAPASFTVREHCPSGHTCRNATAEAILEADNGSFLSRFSPVTFSNSSVTSRGGTRGAFGNTTLWDLAEPVMTGSNGQPLAHVSRLSNRGRNFTITYHEAT
ncbi:MAG TPA: G1 family glutamic endopeptidase [Pseudonocardiaceae bacterium]|nr:G1 family glutamic endopeptidase [Pseudonocardiaceae bacterium]